MILSIRDLKNSIRKLLETIKIIQPCGRIQNQLAQFNSFSIYQQQTYKEIIDTFPFTIPSKKIKYLETNLKKEVKNLDNENLKYLKKEIKTLEKWKDTLCSWIGKINFVKMIILLKVINRFSAIPIQNPHLILPRNRNTILKFICNHKRP